MLASTRVITSLICFAIAIVTGIFHYKAESLVSRRQATILDYRNIVDLSVYEQPLTVSAGAKVSDIERYLQTSNFGECRPEAKADLAVMPPRTVCKRGNILAVKSFAPFDDYIFEINHKPARVRAISTADERVDEARLPSPIFSAANLDDKGRIQERVRFDLLLDKDVDVDSLPIKLFVEIEDRRFFQHRGNDWPGIARATYRGTLTLLHLTADEPLQGGSSITEQTAKLLFLSEKNKIWRRVKALFLAESLEQKFTKRQILELWLNLTVMGLERPTEKPAGLEFAQRREMVRGFKTAARVLFNKSLNQCTPSELATLAVLPRDPKIFPSLGKSGELNVSSNPNHRLLDVRRKKALETFASALKEAGQKEASVRFDNARKVPVKFAFHEDDLKGDEALITFMERDLKSQVDALRLAPAEPNDEARHKRILLLTTIDRDFQRALSQRIEKELPGIKSKLVKLTGATPEAKRAGGKRGFSFEVQVDVVALSAEDGMLRALSSLKTRGNRVTPNRANVNPPSFVSSIAKPLITAYALGEGVVTLQTLIRPNDCVAPNGFRFEGSADDDRLLPLSDHLIKSRNPPFICVGNRLGIEKVLLKWQEIFPGCPLPGKEFVSDPYQILRGLNRPEAALAPTDVAMAYTALSHQGRQQTLRVIDSMYRDNEKLPLSVNAVRQVFNPEGATLVATLLRAGTKNLSQWQPTPGFDLALKTGSSSNTYWVVMFAPKTVVVVRYLIAPPEKLDDEKEAAKFSREVSRRFERVFAGNVVKPFADSVLEVIRQKRINWLRGTFTHENIVALRIDPARDCVLNDGSGIPANYIRGTEPKPCPIQTASEGDIEE